MVQTFSKRVVEELIGYLKERVDAKVKDVRIGIFYTGVKLSTGHGGVAFTPRDEVMEATCCNKSHHKMAKAGNLSGMDLKEALELSKNENPLMRAIGIASINASSQILLPYENYDVSNLDPLDLVEVRRDDTVTMVGAFPSYIRRIRGFAKRLYVFDYNKRALKEHGLLEPPVSLEEALEESNFIIATGSIFITETADLIIDRASKARELIIVGPTASMIPKPLFDRGVTCIGGIKINNADKMLQIVSEAGAGKALLAHCAEKYTIRKFKKL